MSVCKTKCIKLINMWAAQNKRTDYFNVQKKKNCMHCAFHCIYLVLHSSYGCLGMKFHSATKMSSQSMMMGPLCLLNKTLLHRKERADACANNPLKII